MCLRPPYCIFSSSTGRWWPSRLSKCFTPFFFVSSRASAEAGPRSRVEKVAADVEAEAWCVGDVFFMPVATQE